MTTIVDRVVLARDQLIQARLQLESLWIDFRHHAGDNADAPVFEVMTKLWDVHAELDSAIEAELHTPDDPIVAVERITRNGGRDA